MHTFRHSSTQPYRRAPRHATVGADEDDLAAIRCAAAADPDQLQRAVLEEAVD